MNNSLTLITIPVSWLVYSVTYASHETGTRQGRNLKDYAQLIIFWNTTGNMGRV